MSGQDKPQIDLNEFFRLNSECLIEGVRLTFDCFLQPEKSTKILHWIRAGGLFRADHIEKLNRLGLNSVLVPNFQKKELATYVAQLPAAERARVMDLLRGLNLDPGQVISELPQPTPPPASLVKVVDAQTPPPSSTLTIVKGGGGQVFGISKLVTGQLPGESRAVAAAQKGQKINTTPRVDVSFLNPFIMATQQAFNDICHTQIQFSAPVSRLQKGAQVMRIQIAAFVSLVSQSIRGSIGLCFPKETYLATISKVVGRQVTDIDSDNVAGSGELINYIFEIARPILIEKGFPLEQAVPMFVAGEDLSLPYLIPDPGFSIVFDSEHGPFQFEVGIKTAT